MRNRVWEALASLRFTVALLVASMVLIFVGTLAQTRLGVWQAVDAYFRSLIAWVDPALFIPGIHGGDSLGGMHIPIPGGGAIAAMMMVNLIAAHVARFRATLRRVGVLVLHGGVIVLLAGEFVTGLMSDEGLMSIDEGQSASFIEDVREAELVVIDPTDAQQDRVITVPASLLVRAAAGGGTLSDPRLPFEVEVDRWVPNAVLLKARGEETPATSGVGLEARAEERPRVRGVDGGETDTPAAYVTLHRDGDTLGTWLVSAALRDAQPVRLDGVDFGLALRYRRAYLPYTLHLKDFRHDKFVGTTIAKNFSSDIRLVDPARGTDRDVRIWMNHPLRYQGRTFYQASYKPDGSGTVLQVVRNPGWLLPYLACVLVGGGMALHFGQTLMRFLRGRGRRQQGLNEARLGGLDEEAVDQGSTPMIRLWPWAVGIAGVLIAVSGLFRSPATGNFDTRLLAEIPVSAGGRIKPLDTAARNLLMVAGGRQRVRTDDGTVEATPFLLDLITRPDRVRDLPVVRVDHPDVLALLGLKPGEGGRIALSAIEPYWDHVVAQAERASGVPRSARDGFQRAVLELHHRVNTILAHAQLREPYMIPPLSEHGSWKPFHEVFMDGRVSGEIHPSVAYITTMMTAAHEGDGDGLTRSAGAYTDLLEHSMPGVMQRMRLEVLFNRASLFTKTIAVYLLSLLVVCVSFVLRVRSEGLAEKLRTGGFALLVAAVMVHTVAIAIRVYLQGRPPVTNLYSSAIFVGWAAAVAGIFLERLYPLGVAIFGASVIGCGTLIVAHNLGNDGDTMQMMQAVLDSNFWLSTHVITITLGYSATFLAGVMGCVYLLGRALTRSMTPQRERALATMIYGVVCFAMLLSFVGTMLGGIWADQSWGRFWGWDPKENGAALVVLINAIILHARWGGMVRVRGMAALAVVGNIVTAWSWFGTNMLGVGLHAYGFIDAAVVWLGLFVLSQIAIVVIGTCLDRRHTSTTTR